MKVDIFIRSYARDFQWLGFCLDSIHKYCTGFHDVVLAVPIQDRTALITQYPGVVRNSNVVWAQDPGPEGYLNQQISKLYADEHCTSDFIIYLDSDCIFTRPTKASEFFTDSRPNMLITPYSALGNAVPWKPITEKALGFTCPYETMRRLPFVYPRALLSDVREHLWNTHGRLAWQYVTEQPGRQFSEFNVLGAYAHKFRPNLFHFIDTTKHALPETPVMQNWSWGGISAELDAELRRITR